MLGPRRPTALEALSRTHRRPGRGSARRRAGCLTLILSLGPLISGCTAATDPAPTPSATVDPSPSSPPDPVVRDLGSMPHARGAAQQLEPVIVRAGGPEQPRISYTIVRGDTIDGIRTRFELCAQDFQDSNPSAVDIALMPGGHLLLMRSTLQPYTPSCA